MKSGYPCQALNSRGPTALSAESWGRPLPPAVATEWVLDELFLGEPRAALRAVPDRRGAADHGRGSLREYLDDYPPLELFEYIPKIGNKYCLSEKYNPKSTRRIIEHAVLARVPSLGQVAGLRLRRAGRAGASALVDLGFKRRSTGQQLQATPARLLAGSWWQGEDRLSARFEFSMLPADGGSVTPHTDNPDKIITMVVSMARTASGTRRLAAAPRSTAIAGRS